MLAHGVFQYGIGKRKSIEREIRNAILFRMDSDPKEHVNVPQIEL